MTPSARPVTLAAPRRRTQRLAAVLVAAALALGLQTSAPAPTASATAQPPAASVVPAGIEDLAAYVPANDCSPSTKPGTALLGKLLVKTYPGTSFGGARSCPTSPNSEHHDGRAVDWMNSVRSAKQKKQAKAVIAWLFAPDAQGRPYANARRLGVMYVIWDNHIWGAYRADDGWREYNGCTAKSKQKKSQDAACHRNHMHLSLSWEGAMGTTSYWTGQVAGRDYGSCRGAEMSWAPTRTAVNPVPCPRVAGPSVPKGASKTLKTLITYSGRSMTKGSSYGAVKAVQKTIGVKQTGTYSASTLEAMQAWQTAHGLTATGTLDDATWRALERSIWPG